MAAPFTVVRLETAKLTSGKSEITTVLQDNGILLQHEAE